MYDLLDDILINAGDRVLDRGFNYRLENRIYELRKSGNTIHGKIHGSEDYSFTINILNESSSCSCPADWPCKHLVAAAFTIIDKHPEWLGEDMSAAQNRPGATAREGALVINRSRAYFAAIDPQGGLEPVKYPEKISARNGKIFTPLFNAGPETDLDDISEDLLYNLRLFSPDNQELSYQGKIPLVQSLVRDKEGLYVIRNSFTHPLTGKNTVLGDLPHRFSPEKIAFHYAGKKTKKPQPCWLVTTGNSSAGSLYGFLHGGSRKFSGREIASMKDLIDRAGVHYEPSVFPLIHDKGPELVLSLWPDDDKRFKIMAEYEMFYTNDKNNLPSASPEILSQNNEGLYGRIPAKIRKKPLRFFYDSDSSGNIIKRDTTAEEKLVNRTISFNSRYRQSFTVSLKSLPEFVKTELPRLRSKGVIVNIHRSLVHLVDNSRVVRSIFDFEPSPEKTDWFEGKITIEGMPAGEFALALQAYRKKESVFKLSDGTWVSLERLGIERLINSLEEMGIRINSDGSVKKMNRGQILSIEMEVDARTDKGISGLGKKIMNLPEARRKADKRSFASRFAGKFRPYQKDGILFLESLYHLGLGGILADDMGLGKTIQGLGFIDRAGLQNKKEHIVLIVGPLAAISVWKREAERFFPHFSVTLWHGSQRKSVPFPEKGIVLTTYGTLSRDFENWQGRHKFDIVLLDEAQHLKNHRSLIAHAVRNTHAGAVYCLTGTPVENRLADLWSLFDIFFPGYLGTRKSFVKRWPHADADLKRKIAPFILRRTKEKVLKELPPLTESSIAVPMTDKQRRLYEEARKEAVIELAMAGRDYLMKLLPHLTKLRRIASHPEAGQPDKTDPLLSGKFVHLREILEELAESSSGVLIFSQFSDILKICAKLLNSAGYGHYYLDGSTTLKKREKMVHDFQEGNNRFFLISLKAGGTALTLHRADTVIHLDPWWNPAAERQASDRAHRIGQKKRVFVYKLYSENSIEEKVLALQGRKKEMFNSLFGDVQSAGTVSREELQRLLED